MLHKTLLSAQKEPPASASWVQKAIVRVELPDGRVYFRTYQFDCYNHKCKRCRKAERNRYGSRPRLPSTGETCSICGNPFGAFVRRYTSKRTGTWEVYRDSWASSGKLH